jgi:hypothetical protein
VSEGVELVADGDPCPIHGLESRVYQGPCGPFNQCEGCRSDFLDWYGAQRYVVVAPIVLERRPKKEKELKAKPLPAQIGLAL